LGSALSVRSFTKFGSKASVFSHVAFGSSFSMRSFARLGSSISVGGNARVGTRLYIGNEHNYVKYVGGVDNTVTTAYAFWADNGSSASTRRITLGQGTTNYLHGTWESQTAITVLSDRRLKKNIRPLYEALIEEHLRVNNNLSDRPSSWELQKNGTIGAEPLASEMFRKLRPVAFSMKTDHESKRTNFGFIAQELQELYPSVVHGKDSGDGHLTVSYTDLIAVITLTVQQEMSRLDMVQTMLEKTEVTAGEHKILLAESDTKITMLEQELMKLKNSYVERVQKLALEERESR
jgi:hypothetical protein